MKRLILKCGSVIVLMGLFANSSFGGTTDQWSVKLGYNKTVPHVESGDLTGMPGAKVDVSSANNVIGSIAYSFTDHIGAEFLFGSKQKHDLSGAGTAAGTGKLGSIDVMSPTLIGQYRFLETKADFRPYLGLGITKTTFKNGEGTPTLTAITNPAGPQTNFSADSAWGTVLQAGMTYAFTEKFFVDLSFEKVYLKTTARLSTGQTIDLKLNPVATSVSLGYKF
jgi:outer membrane protein